MRYMKRLIAIMTVGICIAFIAAKVSAQNGAMIVTPNEVKWPPAAAGAVGTSGVAGIQTVVLKGDPAKPGLYTLLLRLGPNQKIEAHAHPDDRVAMVVSGTWYFAYGRQFDESKLRALPPGSFYTEPPNVDHFAMTKGEGVTIQITGTGPSNTTYVNPANQPR
jgi:quercetin dioxygenase-like cupin family protein